MAEFNVCLSFKLFGPILKEALRIRFFLFLEKITTSKAKENFGEIKTWGNHFQEFCTKISAYCWRSSFCHKTNDITLRAFSNKFVVPLRNRDQAIKYSRYVIDDNISMLHLYFLALNYLCYHFSTHPSLKQDTILRILISWKCIQQCWFSLTRSTDYNQPLIVLIILSCLQFFHIWLLRSFCNLRRGSFVNSRALHRCKYLLLIADLDFLLF